MRGLLIGIVLSLLIIPALASATEWYVRPYGGSYGLEDGSSYANAWDGLENVVWGTGGVEAGDTLYVCGTHLVQESGGITEGKHDIMIATSGSPGNPVTIRGDCLNDEGIIWGHWIDERYPWTSEGSNTYSKTLQAGMGHKFILQDISGTDYTKLTERGSVQEVMDNPGSYYATGWSWAGETFYVHTTEGGDPTGRIAFTHWGYQLWPQAGSTDITFSNLKWYGIHRFTFPTGNNNFRWTWENCTFHICTNQEIFSIYDHNHNLTWEGSLFEHSQTAIYTHSATNDAPSYGTVRNCVIRDQGTGDNWGIGGDNHGLGIQGGHDWLIEYNDISSCNEGIVFYLDETMDSYDNIVRYNYIHDLNDQGNAFGMSFSCDTNSGDADHSGNRIYNNIIAGNRRAGGRGLYWKWSEPPDFYNNVIYNFDIGVRTNGPADFSGEVKLRNNIILDTGTYVFYILGRAPGSYVVDSDYNIIYPAAGSQFYLKDDEGEIITDFNGWQAISKPGFTFDPHSLTNDPEFVSASPQIPSDFMLQSDSPAIDNGTDVGLTMDFDGNPIVGNPDIGAYEYQGTGDTWYVRPSGGSYGNEDGSSYANAWDGLESVVWGSGGVQAGDTLYVCGLHLRTRTGGSAWEVFTPGTSGTDENARITIRGDCPGDQGIIWGAGIMAHSTWLDEGSGVWSIPTVGTNAANWYFEDVTKDSWTVYTKAYNFNELQATPGSFYLPDSTAGAKLYVHTSDGQDPTGRIAANRLGYHMTMNDKHYINWYNLKFYAIYRWLEYGQTNPGVITYQRWENCTMWYGELIFFLFRNHNNHNEFINSEFAYVKNGIGFAEYPIGSGSGPEGDGSEPSDMLISGCTFHHIGMPYGDADAHAISGQGSRNIIVENNHIYLAGSGITWYVYNTNQSAKNITIRYNWIHDTIVCCRESDPTMCSNSRGIELNTGPGQAPGTSADVYGNIAGPNVNDVCYRYFWIEMGEFYNNVAYDCGTSFYMHHSLFPVNAIIRNCISMNPQTYHIRFSSNNVSGLTSLDSDYNIFYPVGQDNFFIYVPEERITDLSFSEWQALSIPGDTFDTHSLALDPMFLDPENGNFRLQSTSPAIDSGTDVGLTIDFDGNPITGIPDIGAFEYADCGPVEGDLNGDCSVTILDLAIIALDFGKRSGFDIRADTDGSGEIDVYDLVFVASRFT